MRHVVIVMLLLLSTTATGASSQQNPPLNWTPGVSLVTGRSDSQAALGTDGRIYVIGGNVSPTSPYSTATCERFDEALGTWAQLPSMGMPHASHAVAVDYLGRIYAIGGFGDQMTAVCERFDPAPGAFTWSMIAPLPQPLGYPRAVATPDGQSIIVFGGQTSSNTASNTCYRFDVPTGTWNVEPSAIHGHRTPAMAITRAGVIYATGMNGTVVHLQRRDPISGAWTDLGPTPITYDQIGACVADQFDAIYFMGGYGGWATSAVWRFDSRSGVWSSDTSLPSPTANMAAVVSSTWRLYLLGGDPGSGSTRSRTVLYSQLTASPRARVTRGGPGCAGSAGVPDLNTTQPPVLGTTLSLTLSNLPSVAFAFGLIGLSDTMNGGMPLPMDLTSLGMPGCFLRVSIEKVDPLSSIGTGSSHWSLFLPADPCLAGVPVFLQAFVTDLPANSMGLTVTNSLRLDIGF